MYIDLASTCQLLDLPNQAARLTLLLENKSFTPRPELLCIMVLYSSSSSSLKSYNEAVGEVGRAGDIGGVGFTAEEPMSPACGHPPPLFDLKFRGNFLSDAG